jgi:hypothetical protein
MKRIRLANSIGGVGAVVGVLLAILPSAGAANRTMHGVVLARSPARHSLAVSSTAGVVRTVHARSIRVGTRVDVVARRLRDGTFQALRISAVGRAGVAQIHEAVVIRQAPGWLLVVAGGSRLRIRTTGRTLAGLGTSRLRPGSVINATLRISSSGALSLASLNHVQPPLGTTGTSGTTGATGDDGDAEGDDDCTGTSGTTGATGTTGVTGDDDDQGDEDDQGEDECGTTGATGASGDEGDDDSEVGGDD